MSHRRIPVSDENGTATGAGAPSSSDPEAPSGSAPRDGRPSGSAEPRDPGEPPTSRGDGGGEAGPATAAREGREGPGEAALRDQLLRLAAEFDNFRKRESRERAETWGRAKADLVEKLLPALDDLRRVAHPETADASTAAVRALLEGVELVERKLLQTLEREGLAPIEAENAVFDPALHDAILTQPTDRPEQDGRIAQVALPGYRFGERLLRPAKVVVWKLRR